MDPISISQFLTSISQIATITKTAVQARDESKRVEALLDLNGALADLQSRYLTIIQQQQTLLEENKALNKQIADHNKWEQEKTRYSLKGFSSGGFVYALNQEQSGIDPSHWICTNCYEEGEKGILQPFDITTTGKPGNGWFCPRCETKINTGNNWPQNSWQKK